MSIKFLTLNREDRQEIFNEIFRQKNLSPIAIEKDWWVVQTLRLVLTWKWRSHWFSKEVPR